MKFRFPIVIIDEDYRSENSSGLGIRALAKAMEDEGMEVLGVTSYGDLSQFAQQQSRASAFVLSIDDEEFGEGTEEEICVQLTDALREKTEKDIELGYTTVGPHRDDLKIKVNGTDVRTYGSQGQQKSFLVALKLAQYRIVGADKGEKPILLLDDLFDKLDMGRVEQLIKLVSGEEFGQIVITDCNKVRLETILGRQGGDYRLYVVANGEIAK